MTPSQIAQKLLGSADDRFGPVLDAFVEAVQQVDGLTAVAITGSIAAGTADEYSDLDLQCQLRERTAEGAEAVRAAVHAVITVGDERWTIPLRVLSTVSTDWLRFDVSVLDLNEALAPEAVVVWTAGVGDIRRAEPRVFQPDPVQLTRDTTRFLRSVGLIVRDLHRGDLRLGCFATEFLIEELVSLMYRQQGRQRGAQKGTYAHLPPSDIDALQRLPVATPDKTSIVNAHLAVADEYLPRARVLSKAWGAEWPAAMVSGTRAFLATHLGATIADV